MFLATYNDPAISGIWTRDPTKLLSYVLKTCNPHFHRLIDELPKSIPQSVIRHMKSIMGLDNQPAIDAWHEKVAAEPYEEVKNWHAHKLANPFVLASVNKFLSKIDPDCWDTTPNHSNYGESAHAGRNAETSIGVALVTAILQAKERDNDMAKELAQIERDGVTRNRFNGAAEREKLAAQRQVAKLRRSAVRNDQMTSYSTLQAEREAGVAENKASLERQRLFETQIRSLQDQLKIDKRRGDLREEVNILRRDVEDEKSLRREWNTRRAQIDVELSDLRKGPLAGARIKGRRPAEDPSVGNRSVTDLGEGDNESDEAQDVETDLPAELDPSFTERNIVQLENAFSSAELEPSIQDWDWPSSVQPDANFTADMRAFEQNMIPNPTDFDFDFDEFLASCNPMTLNFGAPEGSNIPQNVPDELEYMGDPAIDYSGSSLVQQGNTTSLPPFQSLDLQHQELPPLPMPAMSPPEEQSEDEGDGHNVTTSRPRLDIDLELDERNVIAGKRQRTQSTRAREIAAAPPSKKKNVA
ncbi:hypothetical protein C8R43DRAFT_1208786 [Mycena crocata]|nr:hypothetical protein C8R43DRAFT_1208786 [Mycena crocata]